MRFGIVTPNVGQFGQPREAARIARTAEDASWDGHFLWDGLGFLWDDSAPTFDPWVILSSVAAATERIRLGTGVAALSRYDPHHLAVALTSLDHLADGRLVLGAGLGASERELSAFGRAGDARTRAARVDEGLEVMTRLWSGEEVAHSGEHFTVDHVTLDPLPIQKPRIPIWIGGNTIPGLRRAARWDGWFGPTDEWPNSTPDDLRAYCDRIHAERERIAPERRSDMPIEICWGGYSEPGDGEVAKSFEQAGATWWIDIIDWSRGTFDQALARVAAGPPR